MNRRLQNVLLLAGLLTAQQAVADVAVNATNFPDKEFRRWVTEDVDDDQNDILSDEEIANVTSGDFGGLKIASFKGLEYFTDITELYIANNEVVTTLDLTGLSNLNDANIYRNPNLKSIKLPLNAQVEEVNLSNNPSLTTIEWGNKASFKDIDLEGDSNLKGFSFTDFTNLEDFDIRGCTSWGAELNISYLKNLWYGHYANTPITTLIAKGGAWRDWWSMSGEDQITTIDGSDDTELTDLDLYEFPNLTTFKFDNCPNVTSFSYCGKENLKTIDISGIPSLKTIYTYHNPNLKSIKLPLNAQVEEVYLSSNPSLTTIEWGNKASFKDIDLEGDSNIKGFSFTDFTALESFNIQGCTSWGDTIDISGLRPKYVYFAETGIKTLIARQNAVWWWWAWSGTEQVKHLDISNDLSDAKSNDNRYDEINGELNGWLMLETLDITNNVELRRLDVACENLKSIKMDNCPKLIDLRIGHTRVPEFDVAAKLPNLEYLYLDRQDEYARAEWAWKKLDVSKLTHLKELNVYNNMLTYLNLEDNKEMYYEYGLWEQYPDFQLVQLSANEVGIAVDKAFKGEKLTYLKVNETELTPKMTTVDGQQYFVVWNNAATAQSLVGKDKAIYYHYTVGFVPDADSHLQVSGTATSVIKCPSFLTLSATTVNGVYGGTVTAPTVTRSQGYEGQLTFVSSNPQVVTVTADGKLTVVGAGTATITVSGSETTYRQAPAAKTYTVVIAKASPKFAFANATVETVAQDAVPANALDKGIYDGTVKYSSSNEAVAKVDANGKVTTLKGGTVTITATGEATKNCNAAKASYTLTVYSKGDVNHDKAVDVADIASIISAMADSADPIIAGAADVNHDKAVDVADIASVISIMAANARRMGLKVE